MGLGDALLGVGGKGKSFTGEAGEIPMGACHGELQALPAKQFPFFPLKKGERAAWNPVRSVCARACVCFMWGSIQPDDELCLWSAESPLISVGVYGA